LPVITYVLPDGREESVDVPTGQSVMDGSVRNNLPGIVAECGGSCSCATCHVHVDLRSLPLFAPPSAEETELVEFLDGADETSRLSCQLVVTAGCDGSRVTVADNG
jgi:2Fe-2S ferredoxin